MLRSWAHGSCGGARIRGVAPRCVTIMAAPQSDDEGGGPERPAYNALRFGLGTGVRPEELTCSIEVVAALGGPDQSIVADAVEAGGQKVQQERP